MIISIISHALHALLSRIGHLLAFATLSRASNKLALVVSDGNIKWWALVRETSIKGCNALARHTRLRGTDVVVVAGGLKVAINAALVVSSVHADFALLTKVDHTVLAASLAVSLISPSASSGVASRRNANTLSVVTLDPLVILAHAETIAPIVRALVVVRVVARCLTSTRKWKLNAVTAFAWVRAAHIVDAIGSDAGP